MMAETTGHEPEQPTQRWQCLACGEPWDPVPRDREGKQRCPECSGPLRPVPNSPVIPRDRADRALVALSDAQPWLVVHWAGCRTPWTVLKRVEAIDGCTATGERYEETGQHARDILTAFLIKQHAPTSRRVRHTAAD